MVIPIVEYACTVWAPYTRKNIQSLEAVQRKAARFVKTDYGFTLSVTAMLQDLGWPTLEKRRWSLKAIMLFHRSRKLSNDVEASQQCNSCKLLYTYT